MWPSPLPGGSSCSGSPASVQSASGRPYRFRGRAASVTDVVLTTAVMTIATHSSAHAMRTPRAMRTPPRMLSLSASPRALTAAAHATRGKLANREQSVRSDHSLVLDGWRRSRQSQPARGVVRRLGWRERETRDGPTRQVTSGMEEDTRLRRRKDASVVRPLYFLPLRVDVDVDARSPHPPDPTATTAESTLTLTLAGLRPRDTVRTVKGPCFPGSHPRRARPHVT